MEESYKDGLAEVDEILKYADKESLDKIPKDFKKFIKENKSNYKANINPEKDLAEQNLLYETKVILSVLYRDYWSSEDERKIIISKEKEELKNKEREKIEKYNKNNLFKNKKDNSYEEIRILVKEENIVQKILNKIKRFFKLGDR